MIDGLYGHLRIIKHVVFTGSIPLILDTGIANEKDWGISLINENGNESGTNEDGSTWYRESGEDLGENGYRCRWTRMSGQSYDVSSEWKETVHKSFYSMIFRCMSIVDLE